MKAIGLLLGISIVGFVAWLLANNLSADALGMALGICLGVLAGVPTALLLLAAGRCAPTSERADVPMDVGSDYCVIMRKPPRMPVITLAAARQRQLSAPVDMVDAEWCAVERGNVRRQES